MSTQDELAKLREEIAALRREVTQLRAAGVVHHYHHQAAPAPFVMPQPQPVQPLWPGGPLPNTCGGQAIGIGRGELIC